MREILRHTPLFAIEAVVLDTETTGMEPRSARIVEIGAVVVADGAVRLEESFRSFVAAPQPIPTAATAIHGISDADLAGAPRFEAVLPDLVGFIGGRAVIGHTIGFDLAVMKRECALAGLPLPAWPTLDTRLLAELAAPTLAGFSLDSLAAWLEVPAEIRHRALADAVLTARVYLGLASRLREVGLRTVGEAQAASRQLTRAMEDYHRAGWVEPGVDRPDADRLGVERRLDSYPYRHRVRDLMSSPPAFAAEAMPLIPGMRTSVRMQPDGLSFTVSRNALAESCRRTASLGILVAC